MEMSVDLDGKISELRSVNVVSFALIERKNRAYLLAFNARKRSQSRLALTINSMFKKSVPYFRKVEITGVMQEKFMKHNPYRQKLSMMHVNTPGLNTMGLSGEDIEKAPMYGTVKDISTDISSTALDLLEYKWVVRFFRSGTILCFANCHTSDFVRFLKLKVLPLFD